jgi:hypothetical protein
MVKDNPLLRVSPVVKPVMNNVKVLRSGIDPKFPGRLLFPLVSTELTEGSAVFWGVFSW